MIGPISRACVLVLSVATSGQDGYVGYKLEHRGDPDSAVYETANTDPDTGGVVLSQEPDVYLNASLYVGEIDIEVDNITAKINLDAQVLKLLHFSAGVDASIDRVKLTIQNISAKVELEARLENVVQMVNDVLHSIDLNPIIATLGQDVNKIVNTTVGALTQPVDSNGNPTGGNSKRSDLSYDYNLQHNILYSINNYQGQAHTNRVLAQNGSMYDIFLDNDGNEHGRQLVGFYSDLMTFNGHNRTIAIDGQTTLYELQYIYTPFAGIEVISWIYQNTAGKVTRTQVIAEANAGGTSTISDDDDI
ncbi:hypothetical protein CONLIGDRAFT_651763 [Coniochaeta ligniaria NRRL 30616]|uniref:Uncharacterized protein n=1 Tax=Coniochaeta ligniaria NRRL 30616 TaxID=1408157 RepID=A0A1J7JSJ3_9PEZI|nr:hypothetical protein CONLIGDRAFT_651763 [Coniochaeta ligniaria NRRL 30616]